MKLIHLIYIQLGVAIASLSFLSISPALAAVQDPIKTDGTSNNFGPALGKVDGNGRPVFAPDVSPDIKNSLAHIGNTIINIVFLLAAIIAILYLVYSGIQYITSAGNTEKTKIARMSILNSVLGIIIIGAAYGIILFAENIGGGIYTASLNH